MRSGLATIAGRAAALGGLLVLAALVVPAVALADNCSGFGDCYGLEVGAFLAGGALPFLIAMARRGPPLVGPPPPPTEFRSLPPSPQELEREQKHYNDQSKKYWDDEYKRLQNYPWLTDPAEKKSRMDYAARRSAYYGSNPGSPPGDGKPTSAQAFSSSGAGTKA